MLGGWGSCDLPTEGVVVGMDGVGLPVMPSVVVVIVVVIIGVVVRNVVSTGVVDGIVTNVVPVSEKTNKDVCTIKYSETSHLRPLI